MKKLLFNEERNSFFGNHDKQQVLLPQIVWHITEKCNLTCLFCFSKKNGNEFNICKISSNIDLFKKLGVIKIDLSGGETLLHKEFIPLVNKLYEEGFKLTVTTNGSIRNENTIWLLENLNKFVRVMVSIDAYGEIHNEIRGMNGLFRLADEFIKTVIKSDPTKLRINTVINNHILDNRNFSILNKYIKDISPLEWCLVEPHPANVKDQISNRFKNLSINLLPNIVGMENTNIIYRTRDDYSEYWVIDADNTLSKHSNEASYEYITQFLSSEYEEIIKQIKKRRVGIPMSEYVKIVNSEKTEIVAEVLGHLNQIATEKKLDVKAEKENIQGAKGEILNTIIVGVSINIISDILKYCVAKVNTKRKISDNEVIEIDGEIKKLNDYK